MSLYTLGILAGLTAPLRIETNPQALLWLLPVTAAIAVVYKATKMNEITARSFTREVVILFCSIAVVVIIIGASLCGLARLLT
jgi:hypothetical protein